MHHALCDRDALLGVEFNGFVFKVDEQLALQHEEELIIMLMFMPMKFSFNNAESHHALIHLRKSLIGPLRFCIAYNFRDIYFLKVIKTDVKIDVVIELFFHKLF